MHVEFIEVSTYTWPCQEITEEQIKRTVKGANVWTICAPKGNNK